LLTTNSHGPLSSSVLPVRGLVDLYQFSFGSPRHSPTVTALIKHQLDSTYVGAVSGNTPPITLCLERLQHVHGQVLSSLLVDIVGNGQPLLGGGIARVDYLGKVVLCVLNKVRSRAGVIICVDIKIDDMVA